MFTRKTIYAMLIMLSLLFSACQPAAFPDEPVILPTENPSKPYPVDGDEGKFIYGQDATVESLKVVLLESFPLQAQAEVTGYFPNGCIELHEISAEQQEMNFILTITTRRPTGDMACTEALVPFEEVVALDIEGLVAGTYHVIAQDREVKFELVVDNVLQEQVNDMKFAFGSDAVLRSMSLNIMESFPVQVSVNLSGYLPNGCVKIDQINVLKDGEIFTIRIITKRPTGDVSCTMAIVPFEETVALEVEGLLAGEYTVQCDDISDTFTFQQDNKVQ